MKINDKVLVAFLVSVGIFSANVAVKYVSGLSDVQKNSLLSSVKSPERITLLASTFPVAEGDGETKRG